MRLPRSVIGQHVEVRYRDPFERRISMRRLEDLPKGWEGLAVQTERGVFTDITDGVARLEQGIGEDPPAFVNELSTKDYSVSYILEALIEDVFVFDGKRSLKEGAAYKAEKEGGGT